MSSPDLTGRIRRLEDRAALEDLVIRYFVAADDDDTETLAATFAPDAEFFAGGACCGSGRAAVVAFIRDDRRNMGVTVHTQNYTLLTFDSDDGPDDRASGIVGVHLELARGGSTVYGAARYYDNYVRTERGWCFARREIKMIHLGDWREVATSLTSDLRVRWPGRDPAPADLPC
ncbi:MAG TPA: nuclear transport factor 2 family protein [Pseudonocardia sp.]